ncbi:MAG TPA: NAD(P)H-dependent oxidoreductase [Thermoleophilaceae bacterium]
MAHLLHIDSSIRLEGSVSRALTQRAARAWLDAHPGGTITYRDLGAEPVPHLDTAGGLARHVPPIEHNPAQAASWKRSQELVAEIEQAETIVLGLPLYNLGAPSSLKAWADHLVAPGLSIDPDSHEGLLGGRDFVVVATRGGGSTPGAPRDPWDDPALWLPHAIALTGLAPRFIRVEFTFADVNPAMSQFVPLARESRARAEHEIDALWRPAALAA